MTRHPATEGNNLKPRRVDAMEDVSVGGRSIADAASGVYIQSDEPEDPPHGARWTDTSDSPPRTKIYDDSSGAWIPINAGDRTFVSESEPDEPLQGDIWFDQSPDDGVDMFWYNGDNWAFLQFIADIPDKLCLSIDQTNTTSESRGIKFELKDDFNGSLPYQLSDQNEEVVEITLYEDSNEIKSESVDLGPGDTFEFEFDYVGGQTYRVEAQPSSDNNEYGLLDDSNLPEENDDIKVTGGSRDGDDDGVLASIICIGAD